MIEKEDYLTSKLGKRILYDGKFNFEELKSSIKSWYRSRRYNLTEKEYAVKEKPSGQNIDISWQGSRKFDDYARFHIDIKLKIEDMTHQGSSDDAKIEIRLTSYVLLDYKESFDSKMGKFMMSVYHNYIIKSKIQDTYEEKLSRELSEINSILKEQFDLLT